MGINGTWGREPGISYRQGHSYTVAGTQGIIDLSLGPSQLFAQCATSKCWKGPGDEASLAYHTGDSTGNWLVKCS